MEIEIVGHEFHTSVIRHTPEGILKSHTLKKYSIINVPS